jgi:hypothetical protein
VGEWFDQKTSFEQAGKNRFASQDKALTGYGCLNS